jgi:hypothetical protein
MKHLMILSPAAVAAMALMAFAGGAASFPRAPKSLER